MLENTQSDPQQRTRNTRPTNRRANAIFLKIAGGRFRAYSLLKHVGRKSGREYRTPVSAFPFGDGYVLALLYGDAAEVDWVRNVMAAGTCLLTTRGREYLLERPEIIPASKALEAYPPLFRLMYQARGIQQFLWVHRQPG
jgi:deazaflavin-dependent oxidoreductase (nitroreductase family)